MSRSVISAQSASRQTSAGRPGFRFSFLPRPAPPLSLGELIGPCGLRHVQRAHGADGSDAEYVRLAAIGGPLILFLGLGRGGPPVPSNHSTSSVLPKSG